MTDLRSAADIVSKVRVRIQDRLATEDRAAFITPEWQSTPAWGCSSVLFGTSPRLNGSRQGCSTYVAGRSYHRVTHAVGLG